MSREWFFSPQSSVQRVQFLSSIQCSESEFSLLGPVFRVNFLSSIQCSESEFSLLGPVSRELIFFSSVQRSESEFSLLGPVFREWIRESDISFCLSGVVWGRSRHFKVLVSSSFRCLKREQTPQSTSLFIIPALEGCKTQCARSSVIPAFKEWKPQSTSFSIFPVFGEWKRQSTILFIISVFEEWKRQSTSFFIISLFEEWKPQSTRSSPFQRLRNANLKVLGPPSFQCLKSANLKVLDPPSFQCLKSANLKVLGPPSFQCLKSANHSVSLFLRGIFFLLDVLFFSYGNNSGSVTSHRGRKLAEFFDTWIPVGSSVMWQSSDAFEQLPLPWLWRTVKNVSWLDVQVCGGCTRCVWWVYLSSVVDVLVVERGRHNSGNNNSMSSWGRG